MAELKDWVSVPCIMLRSIVTRTRTRIQLEDPVTIPGTTLQLLILLLFVLPGSVYQTTRTRLRGPIPSDRDVTSKVLRALAVSTLLNSVYLAVLGDELLEPARARSVADLERTVDLHVAGVWALVTLFVIPAALSVLVFWGSRWEWPKRLLSVSDETRHRWKWARSAYHPVPRTWDFAFTDIEPGYVRVLTGDGKWYGGWFGEQSLAASFPEEPSLFIEQPWDMTEHGDFRRKQESSRGTWVRCDDARVVELVSPWDKPQTPALGRWQRLLAALKLEGSRDA